MVKKILSVYIMAFCFIIYSCAGTYGMDEAVQEYHPRASRSSLFKTALVWLSLMLSPKQVEAGFDGCYLINGNIHTENGGMVGKLNRYISNNITVSQIITTGCFEESKPFYPQMSSKMFTSSNFSIHFIEFCSRSYRDINYNNIIDIGFNISGYNCFPIRYPYDSLSFIITLEKSGIYRGKESYLIKYFLNL